MKLRHATFGALAMAACAGAAQARTITVGPGPGRDFSQLSTALGQSDLAPGDVVLVDGNATYLPVVVESDDSGSPAAPVVIRWTRKAGETRPVIAGGVNTVKFQESNYVVFEGFEVRGGSGTCIFQGGHEVTVRDAVVHTCAAHGILGADAFSGSFTLEYSEVFNAGAGQLKHPLYIQSDEVTWPNAVFRMRFNHVHGGNGGNLLKSRHQRSEIHYNWFEGSAFQEIELIGPDCATQQPGWTPAKAREDAELIGNVIVHTGSWNNVIRVGGDLNGQSRGRVRMVNNTILIDRAAGGVNAVLVQNGLEALEMHNNVIFQTGTAAPAIVKENPTTAAPACQPFSTEPWVAGRRVTGGNNWVETNAELVPGTNEWNWTARGADPGFVDVVQRLLRPREGSASQARSALIDAGNGKPVSPPAHAFDGQTRLPLYDPPRRARIGLGAHVPRIEAWGASIDIGAFEAVDADAVVGPILRNGAPPRMPPPDPPAGLQSAAASANAATVRSTPTVSVAQASPRMARSSRVANPWAARMRGFWMLLRWIGVTR